jgi:hypothetical protein
MEGEMLDRTTERLKHTLQGIALGAALAMVVGFSWLGWTLDSTARSMAREQADSAVVAALSPICVARFMRQPDAPAKLVKLLETDSWKQRELVESGGWATMAGSPSPNSAVASACAEQLAKAKSS